MSWDETIDLAIREGRTAVLRIIADRTPSADTRFCLALLADLIDRQWRNALPMKKCA